MMNIVTIWKPDEINNIGQTLLKVIDGDYMKRRNESMYEPKPIDTSDVILPEELLSLTEKIAENVHDVFVKSRIEEGWVLRLFVMMNYRESEKEYDRNTALETLKLIIKLSYTISRK